jgi:uncharacterized cupin superfamily protein
MSPAGSGSLTGMGTINIISAENTSGRIDVAQQLGSTDVAMYVYDLDPGAGLCPYHYEYVEEWMLVVSGEVTLREPDGVRTAGAGSLLRWAPGPAGAHKVMNRSAAPARVLIWSGAQVPAISVYPDSNKIGVFPTATEDHFFRLDTGVEWATGEEGWNRAD